MKGLKSLLIIDDIMDMRMLIRAFLKTPFPDLIVEEANSGKHAKEMIMARRYDLILCDWELPDIKGDEILSWFRGQEELKDTPFVMVTAHNEKKNITQAISMGVSGYIIKPFNADTLEKTIRKVMRQRIKKDADSEN